MTAIDFLKSIHHVEKFLPPLAYEKGTRTKNNMLIAAYLRLQEFRKQLNSSEISKAFILNVQLRYSKNQVSKVIFGIDLDLGFKNDGFLSDYALIKVCVPSDITLSSYISVNCVMNDCAKTFEEDSKCKYTATTTPVETLGI